MQNELESNVTIGNNDEHAGVEIQPHVFALGKGQKIAVFILGFFTLVLVLMLVSNMVNKIKQPIGNYSKTGDEQAQVKTKTVSSYATTDSKESMQNKDTDKDGLSDWDELNVYKTSPYLEDSDSDGFSDGAEVTSGNNPNCPNGKDCGVFLDATGEDNATAVPHTTAVPPVSGSSANSITSNTSSVQASDSDLQAILSGHSDAKTLRKALLDHGVDKNMLDQISDEDLLKGYQESLSSQ